ncbi:hypothetical protein LTR53_009017 [Teratosphaeriaceae sp. CCFEE 6253]|nr:hypothetical protein LTR53_009017 [Teratosphaeriaceae sp. CCFEE 6253]
MASTNTPPGTSAYQPDRGRFWNRRLRRASFISPATGERSKRVFTLREASHRLNGDADSNERTPLLDGHSSSDGNINEHSDFWRSPWQGAQALVRDQASAAYTFVLSPTGLGILKCSLAYLLASLATLVPAISGAIGHAQDSKHMVATVTVWFHPARSIGSMHEATILAMIALCYSGLVSFTSMAVSMYFGNQDLLLVGHALVLILFIGGGLGFVAWVKQKLGHPLVNVACSLASLGCITILIKEGAVQAGAFSIERVLQVLFMVIMGVIATTLVNVAVLPTTARGSLVKDMEKDTDLLGEILICITRAFLSGRKADLEDEYYKKLMDDHQASSGSMSKNLGEAKRELCLLGKEQQYEIEAKIVDCLTGLSQDLGGLRSAAFAQFAFIDHIVAHEATSFSSPSRRASPNGGPKFPSILGVISEAPEDTTQTNGHREDSPLDSDTAFSTPNRRGSLDMPGFLEMPATLDTPGDMFLAFLAQLGPPAKSLVYTIKQILDELPFRELPKQGWWIRYASIPTVEVAMNENFHDSLRRAIDLYRGARNEALQKLHASRALNASGSQEKAAAKGAKIFGASGFGSPARNRGPEQKSEAILADIEEVSACCGHFSFSLLDFAEDVLTYLHILDELKDEMEHPHYSWRWLVFCGRHPKDSDLRSRVVRQGSVVDPNEEHHLPAEIPAHIRHVDDYVDPEKASAGRPWTYRLYKALHFLRRDDIRFATKVGIGALLYALPAFNAASRPFFVHWRGEWGLVSYMAVCSMTVGASNTTSINRLIGTCIGAALAIFAWVISSDHGEADPWMLGFFGWLMSLGCFYLIIAKNNGPMGRFIMLTYNLGALYSYSLSIRDTDNDDDEGGIDPAIWSIVLHRLVAVIVGCIWAVVITRVIWPISARRKLQDGLCLLWLRMALVWKRDPLAMFLLGEPRSSYMDIREESVMRAFLTNLEGMRKAAAGEYELRGPFPDEAMGSVLEHTARMLDAFHAMNVVISKNLQYTAGEAAVLKFTRPERFELSARISHLFSVLASSVKLEYPLNDLLPSIEHTRDRLLAKISEFRRSGEGREITTEQDYELLYAYVLVTGQLAQEIQGVSADIEELYGTLNEERLKLE